MITYYFEQLIQFAQHNSVMFVSIVITSFFAIFILIILLLNPKKSNINLDSSQTAHSHVVGDDSALQITASDISSIAGDDVCVTQLDLARAYIELGKTMLAKQILENVISDGNQNQQQTAQELLLTL
jgi:FimV-like protein